MKVLKLSLLALCLLVPGYLFADDWAHRANNGPELTGTSIPVRLDQGITVENAEQAQRTCLLTGDSTRGLVSMIQRMIQDVYQVTPTKIERSMMTFDRERRWFQILLGRLSAVLPSDQVNPPERQRRLIEIAMQVKAHSLEQMDQRFLVSLTDPNQTWIERSSSSSETRQIYMQTPGKFPVLEFNEELVDRRYDKWGREIEGRRYLKGLSIRIPGDYGSGIVLINQTTWRETPLSVNLMEYVECLQNELQRLAE